MSGVPPNHDESSRERAVGTQAQCPGCRLRFTRAAAAYLPACPWCGEPLQPLLSLYDAVGLRLYGPDDLPSWMPEAAAASQTVPDPEAAP